MITATALLLLFLTALVASQAYDPSLGWRHKTATLAHRALWPLAGLYAVAVLAWWVTS